jgi:hypothetical protein
MTPKQTLIAARALIEKPENWTQHRMSANKKGVSVPLDDPEATCFCSIGAISKIAGTLYLTNTAVKALSKAMDIHPGYYNDTHTHAEVLQMFDLAIEAAE